MIKPVAGLAIALRCAVVIRGISKPREVEYNSSKDELSGLVVPIPTLSDWAITVFGKDIVNINKTEKKSRYKDKFIIVNLLKYEFPIFSQLKFLFFIL